jgi:hypothetical protein
MANHPVRRLNRAEYPREIISRTPSSDISLSVRLTCGALLIDEISHLAAA